MTDTTVTRDEATAPFFAGIDVGGTSIKLGIVDDQGRSLLRRQIPTEEERGPDDAMRRVADELEAMYGAAGLQKSDVVAAGLATPGTMDLSRGMTLHPHNLPHWWEFPIRQCLQAACGKDVTYFNDANAAAFGEFWVGSGSDFHSIAFFTLGTGVGGGIIIGDLSIDGENSAGSELGHTIIDYNDSARMCGCGQRGHLEAYASAKAVIQRTQEALDEHSDSRIQQRVKEGEILTPLLVAQVAEAGDRLALQIVLETAKYLGIGAVNVMHVIDPGAVIFGGAMDFGGRESPLGQQFLERIREEVRQRAFPVLAEKTRIEFASLGGDAGYIGAAGIARANYRTTQ